MLPARKSNIVYIFAGFLLLNLRDMEKVLFFGSRKGVLHLMGGVPLLSLPLGGGDTPFLALPLGGGIKGERIVTAPSSVTS